MKNKPYILSGLLIIIGYMHSALIREERSISPELMQFTRKEQIQRLINKLQKE